VWAVFVVLELIVAIAAAGILTAAWRAEGRRPV
jgi:hypothetical protein